MSPLEDERTAKDAKGSGGKNHSLDPLPEKRDVEVDEEPRDRLAVG
jgi:hypothetical protein